MHKRGICLKEILLIYSEYEYLKYTKLTFLSFSAGLDAEEVNATAVQPKVGSSPYFTCTDLKLSDETRWRVLTQVFMFLPLRSAEALTRCLFSVMYKRGICLKKSLFLFKFFPNLPVLIEVFFFSRVLFHLALSWLSPALPENDLDWLL